MVKAALSALGLAFASSVAAQTTIDHQQIAYFVPEKRVNIAANVSDPKGVKVARTYFKAGAQADYTFVPMQPAGGNRYVATLPAPSASTPAIEYIVLAQSNDGSVSRTDAYKVEARKTRETPAWQSNTGAGDLKVYSEASTAPSTVAGFTDSVTLDIVESGARLGAVAGLQAAGGSGGAAAGSAATAGTVGGLSTMAIVGGVVAAGAVAAAAGGGGGGGGSSAPSGPPAPTLASYAGTWGGSWSINATPVSGCGTGATPVTCSGTWTGNANSTGGFTGTATVTGGSSSCSSGAMANLSGSLNVAGQMTASSADFVNSSAGCSPLSFQFNASPRSVSGSLACTSTNSGCTAQVTVTFSGQ